MHALMLCRHFDKDETMQALVVKGLKMPLSLIETCSATAHTLHFKESQMLRHPSLVLFTRVHWNVLYV